MQIKVMKKIPTTTAELEDWKKAFEEV